ncbi:MAG: adenylate/guanylate cyclase domain-containing protein [Limnobacter sp.]|nr:adenylate/guanylate cyclase domain-containing protein [Limnobacter sp.]
MPQSSFASSQPEKAYLQTASSFLPQALIQWANSEQLQDAHTPFVHHVSGAVLFADLSGFTALSEALHAQGEEAGERLTAHLNFYFGALVDTVLSHGGDVVKFAGDALLAVWSGSTETKLLECQQKAWECSMQLQSCIAHLWHTTEVDLSMKVSLSCGPLSCVCVGGVLERRELLIKGTPLTEIGVANDLAEPGDIMLCASALEHLPNKPACTPASPGVYRRTGPLAGWSVQVPATQDKIQLKTAANQAARQFIPAAIRKSLDAHQADWINQSRRVSLLFVNLPDFQDSLSVEAIQQAVRAMQIALYRFEGSMNKISVDDKGISMLAALGIRPLATPMTPCAPCWPRKPF